MEAQQRAQRRAEGRADEAAPERSHAQHAKTFDGPPPRGSGGEAHTYMHERGLACIALMQIAIITTAGHRLPERPARLPDYPRNPLCMVLRACVG